jgi:rRNA-processing protein FCF1
MMIIHFAISFLFMSRCADDVPPFHNESNIKDEDRDFVRLANLTNVVLATHDEPLISELKRLGVKVAKPEDLAARL